MSDSFTDNAGGARFELHVDGLLAYANYRREGETIVLPYVYADPDLRGKVAADRLMRQVIATARAEGSKVKPVCGYAIAWMRRHPENTDLLA